MASRFNLRLVEFIRAPGDGGGGGGLIGFAAIEFVDVSITIRRIVIRIRNDEIIVCPPREFNPQTGRSRGFLSFADRESFTEFAEQVLDLIQAEHPDLFEDEPETPSCVTPTNSHGDYNVRN